VAEEVVLEVAEQVPQDKIAPTMMALAMGEQDLLTL
tara:strand:- start:76 stop:183 length:108 start_codon:yes stop_codon:yes gene_type:complete